MPHDIADLISKMLTVEPNKRITMSQIKYHLCYAHSSHFFMDEASTTLAQPSARPRGDAGSAPSSPTNGKRFISAPRHVTAEMSDAAIEGHLDDHIVGDLESLGWGTMDQLRRSLRDSSSQQEKPPQEQCYLELPTRERKQSADAERSQVRARKQLPFFGNAIAVPQSLTPLGQGILPSACAKEATETQGATDTEPTCRSAVRAKPHWLGKTRLVCVCEAVDIHA